MILDVCPGQRAFSGGSREFISSLTLTLWVSEFTEESEHLVGVAVPIQLFQNFAIGLQVGGTELLGMEELLFEAGQDSRFRTGIKIVSFFSDQFLEYGKPMAEDPLAITHGFDDRYSKSFEETGEKKGG